MNKVLVGLLLGALLGAFDGLTAWFTPAARNAMAGIVIGSTIKGMIAGVAAGWFARKVQSVVAGIVFGLAVGLLLAWLVAFMQHGYYFEIMLPGAIVGAIVGWATQRYGRPASAAGASAMIFVVALSMLNVRAAEAPAGVTAPEMITIDSLDGKDLVARHDCSMGNQPPMKLDLAASTVDTLVFRPHQRRQNRVPGGWQGRGAVKLELQRTEAILPESC